MTSDEKDLGVALIDIGGGTTDIALYVDGAIKHTSVLSLGGNHLSNDIAVGLRTPMNEAEKIKQKYGCCLTSMVGRDETIEVPSVGDRPPRLWRNKPPGMAGTHSRQERHQLPQQLPGDNID